MFKPFEQQRSAPSYSANIRNWVRERFDLPAECVVVVAEMECQTPGCPPIETGIAFWGPDGTRYRLKIFKPEAQVTPDDLPLKWLLPALEDYGDLGCGCC